ncbi:hypothetical protein Ahy_B01g057065 [Arachis hypogaea]|uniref:Uncharacterized protein n=1 Tax=Arachis hypogaea TaxID=3818 RepID=A0A445B057_ARAHY|nr:hypothetical protein Ahy_B01g057065 [Arachis hypogaea]
MNKDWKSSLLSLVKAFNPVLAIYEDLNCEAILRFFGGDGSGGSQAQNLPWFISEKDFGQGSHCSATHLVLGTCHGHHKIRSSTSVAKYCAKKFSKDCCVLAVNNGKVVFKSDGLPDMAAHDSQGFTIFLVLRFD